MIDSLQEILGRFELRNAEPITAPEARRFGMDMVQQLVSLGLLREVTPASSVRNDECEHACDMVPEIITHAKTGERFGIHRCMHEDCGIVQIPSDELRRWDLYLTGVAAAVADAASAGGNVVVDVPDRIVEVGRVVVDDNWRDVFVARGLAWDDAPARLDEARRLKVSGAPLVLALRDLPTSKIWYDCNPAIALLSDIASLVDGRLRVDFTGIIDRPTQSHASLIESKWITVTAAAEQLLEDVSGINLTKARARVSKAASEGRFHTNGKKGTARRIDQDSFSTWRLEQRAKDLAAYDSNL